VRGAGRGVFLTALQPIPSGLDWAAVVMTANSASRVAALRAAGVRDIYVWDHPRSWRPETWRDGLARMTAFARMHRLAGVIADAESGWESADEADAIELGRALQLTASEFDVGFTSYPGFRFVRTIGRAAPSVWGAVQIYNRGSRSAAVFAQWLAAFRLGFPSTIVIAATFVPDTVAGQDLSTRAGYRAYLGRLPRSYGLATYGAGPGYMAEEIASYRPVESSAMLGPVIGLASAWLPGSIPLPVILTMVIIAAIAIGWLLWSAIRKATQ